jgi:hypothetical protein
VGTKLEALHNVDAIPGQSDKNWPGIVMCSIVTLQSLTDYFPRQRRNGANFKIILTVVMMRHPYIVGNPAIGQHLLGREDIMRKFECLWTEGDRGLSINLYGQRRMGKTSILHNLPSRFGNDEVIDFNMLSVSYVESTGELLYNLALAIYDTLPPSKVAEPSKNKYLVEDPFTAFDHDFLKNIHRRTDKQRIIVTFDEYEIIEELIEGGKIDPKFPGYLGTLIQTYPWLRFVFAGLHDMEEMNQSYWHTLTDFISPIHVDFLSHEDTAKLITNPSPDFNLDCDQDMIDVIYEVTNGQPFLAQLICSDIIVNYNNRLVEDNINYPANFKAHDVLRILQSKEFALRCDPYFSGIWAQAEQDPNQIKVLEVLRWQPLSFIKLLDKTGLSHRLLKSTLNILMRHDVIYLRDDYSHYDYKVWLAAHFVKKQDTNERGLVMQNTDDSIKMANAVKIDELAKLMLESSEAFENTADKVAIEQRNKIWIAVFGMVVILYAAYEANLSIIITLQLVLPWVFIPKIFKNRDREKELEKAFQLATERFRVCVAWADHGNIYPEKKIDLWKKICLVRNKWINFSDIFDVRENIKTRRGLLR